MTGPTLSLREGEIPCSSCHGGAKSPVPYCPTCQGSLKVRECSREDCDQLVPVGAHAMAQHGVCRTHAPDCTGVCYP
jgi:RecJ-like exonuclease